MFKNRTKVGYFYLKTSVYLLTMNVTLMFYYHILLSHVMKSRRVIVKVIQLNSFLKNIIMFNIISHN